METANTSLSETLTTIASFATGNHRMPLDSLKSTWFTDQPCEDVCLNWNSFELKTLHSRRLLKRCAAIRYTHQFFLFFRLFGLGFCGSIIFILNGNYVVLFGTGLTYKLNGGETYKKRWIFMRYCP